MIFALSTAAFFLLRTNSNQRNEDIIKTKEFAQFIEKQPELVHSNQSIHPMIVSPSANASAPTAATSPLPTSSQKLTSSERMELSNILKEWQNPSLVHDLNWRTQIDRLFNLANKTHETEVIDILRRELVRAKMDSNPLNHRYFENYKLEYLKLDSSRASALELE